KAVKRVIDERRAAGLNQAVNARKELGPVGSGHDAVIAADPAGIDLPAGAATPNAAPATRAATPAASRRVDDSKPMPRLQRTFHVAFPRDEVWEFFGRLDQVTTCLPGASLLSEPTATHVEPRLRVKVGPIVAAFEGVADVERDDENYKGTI